MFSFDTSHYLFSICTVHAPEFPKLQNSSLSLGMYILPHLHPNIDSFGSRLPSFRKSRIFCCPWGCTSSPIPTQMLIPLDLSELPSFRKSRIFCCPWGCTSSPIPTQILIPLDLSELRVSETTELFVVPGLLSYAPPIPTQI
ncbi:hypothetical protein BYT27DRAFT_7193350 [Phlegmacium glaucopus]|nr:hypothetical protein BYT27DRAFT_7193350 [Phlegmacium glaucopus]